MAILFLGNRMGGENKGRQMALEAGIHPCPAQLPWEKRAVEQRPMPIGSQEPIKEAGTEACGRPINQPIAAEEGREEAGRTGGRTGGRAGGREGGQARV